MEQQGINPPFIVTDGLTKTYIRREKPENGGITRLWRRGKRGGAPLCPKGIFMYGALYSHRKEV